MFREFRGYRSEVGLLEKALPGVVQLDRRKMRALEGEALGYAHRSTLMAPGERQ